VKFDIEKFRGPRDRTHYASHYTADQLRNMLRAAEDRQTRTDTTVAALQDAYLIQELTAALALTDGVTL
jgi:hypothetical protein